MANGNKIVIRGTEVNGIREEGTLANGGTALPGVIMELKPSTAFTNGRGSYRVYQPGTSGNRKIMFVLNTNPLNGQVATQAYNDGDHIYLYVPQAGDDLNLLVKGVAGTGATTIHNIGDLMIVENASGKLISTTGSEQSDPFQVQGDPAAGTSINADTLVWVKATGY